MNREAFAFWFIIAGALCAECIPFAAALIGAAGVLLGTKKSAARRTGQRKVRRIIKPVSPPKGCEGCATLHCFTQTRKIEI